MESVDLNARYEQSQEELREMRALLQRLTAAVAGHDRSTVNSPTTRPSDTSQTPSDQWGGEDQCI